MSLLLYFPETDPLFLLFLNNLFSEKRKFIKLFLDICQEICLIGKAHLTNVTINMEAAVQGYNPDGLLLPRLGHDGLPTHRAARRVLPVRHNKHPSSELVYAPLSRPQCRVAACKGCLARTVQRLPVKVLYAVYLRRGVHCEGHAVQTAVTNDTREAARVVGFPHGSQDAVQNGFGAL